MRASSLSGWLMRPSSISCRFAAQCGPRRSPPRPRRDKCRFGTGQALARGEYSQRPPHRPRAVRNDEAASMATTVHPPEALTPPLGIATSPAALPKKERLLSLDVFRGLTIAGMLLVNNPGSWAHIYPPLEHAEWN